MSARHRDSSRSVRTLASALPLAFALVCGCALAAEGSLTLNGDQEVPPVKAAGSGAGTITVAPDGAVSGSVKTTGVAGTMAHIHQAPAGQNGPVIIPLVKTADDTWSVPTGVKLSHKQVDSYKAGELYVNVHTEANKGGEIRTQLKP